MELLNFTLLTIQIDRMFFPIFPDAVKTMDKTQAREDTCPPGPK